jgi:hypothetical protein
MRFDVKPITVRFSALAETRWYQYSVRFIFGGLVTAVAGIIAKMFGPATGGLFLAFPAIFPASATLIEKHEREHKAEKGLHGEKRARQAVAADAAGAAMGSIGLMAFGAVIWQWASGASAVLVIGCATLAWAVVSGAIWIAWKRNWLPHRVSGRAVGEQPKPVLRGGKRYLRSR